MVNVLVGNADAHAMNVSFILASDGQVTLSPLYDVFATVAYPQLSVVPGIFVEGVRDIRAITAENLVNEAVAWGMDRERATGVEAQIRLRAQAAMSQVIEEVSPIPAYLADLLQSRVDRFCES